MDENNNFMKPEETIEKVKAEPETLVNPKTSAPAQENVTEPKVEVNVGQPEVKVTIEQPKVEQVKPESKMQKFKSTFKDKMGKLKNFAIKRKPLMIGLSVVVVASIATGATLGVIFANKNSKPKLDNFDKMREGYKNYLLDNTNINNYKDLSAKEIMNKIVIGSRKIDDEHSEPIYGSLEKKTISNVETYFIKEINYDYGSDRDSWPAATHVSQALNLAITAEARHNSKIRDIAIKMTYYWVFNDYRNTNWWQNELGADNNLASLGLFVYDYLNPKGQIALRGRVAEASFYYRESLLTHTGANLFDYADITIKSSLITKNQTEFNIALNRINDEISVDHLESFQTDGSFFQHGQQVQIASYGKGVGRLGKVLSVVTNAGINLSKEKMQIIENYLLRGLRSMTHKGYLNYSAMSREIARDGQVDTAKNNFNQFNTYLNVDTFTKKEELQKYLDDVKDKNSTFDGMVYFDKAKMVVVNVDDVYMSFKGTAPNLTNTECVNDENQLGLNLSYGTNTCVMDTGTEYYNVMPIWDFSFIPGTTSIQVTTNGNLPTNNENVNFVDEDTNILKMRDAYSDQLYEQQLPTPESETGDNKYGYVYSSTKDIETSETDGVTVLMQRSCHHEENKFTVTCIATPEGMVLLGADLNYTGSKTQGDGSIFTPNSRKLHTTIDQAFSVDGEKLDEGDTAFKKGNIVYKSLDGQEMKLVKRNVTGGYWERNSRLKKDAEPTKPTGDTHTTTVYIDTDTSKHYAYSIQSKTKYDANRKFELINNFPTTGDYADTKMQEVKLPDGRTVVVAYEDFEYNGTELKKGEYRIFNA